MPMDVVPKPSERSDTVPFNDVATADIPSGSKATYTFYPDTSRSAFYLPVLAASKERGLVYEVKLDGVTRFGPASIPPTDIDDMGVTFIPAREFRSELRVEVSNLSSTDYTDIHVQPIGWEEK